MSDEPARSYTVAYSQTGESARRDRAVEEWEIAELLRRYHDKGNRAISAVKWGDMEHGLIIGGMISGRALRVWVVIHEDDRVIQVVNVREE